MNKILLAAAAAFIISTFAPKNTVSRLFESEVLIQTEHGRVTSADCESEIRLYGKKSENSPFYKDIRIEILSDDKKLTIVPRTDAGYSPSILVGRFDDSGTDKIYYAADSGGSGGFQYSYVFGAENMRQQILFDYACTENPYTARYTDGYKAEVCSGNEKWLIDISLKPKDYLDNLYNADGTLRLPQNATVTDLTNAFPFYNTSEKKFGLMLVREIYGLYHADKLGYLQQLTSFTDGQFRPYSTTVNVLSF